MAWLQTPQPRFQKRIKKTAVLSTALCIAFIASRATGCLLCYELDDLHLLACAAFGVDYLPAIGSPHPCPKTEFTYPFTF